MKTVLNYLNKFKISALLTIVLLSLYRITVYADDNIFTKANDKLNELAERLYKIMSENDLSTIWWLYLILLVSFIIIIILCLKIRKVKFLKKRSAKYEDTAADNEFNQYRLPTFKEENDFDGIMHDIENYKINITMHHLNGSFSMVYNIRDQLLFGSNEDLCDVTFFDNSIKNIHLELIMDNKTLFIKPYNKHSKVLLNDSCINEKEIITNSDIITLGNIKISIELVKE